MTKELRWRIMSLQVVLVLVLGFMAGVFFWGSSFVNGSVHDQLAAQQIYFPDKGASSFDPKTYPDLQQYAGQQLVTGEQAHAYATGFIGRHLKTIGGGKTYSELSAQAIANPTDTKLANTVATVFKGTTLQSMLLNAWAWSTVGLYAFYAAIGLSIAALVVLGAFLFEITVALRRRETETVARGGRVAAHPA